ncbi:taste receptor type 1 member 1 isoform X1 [Cricetulus griseus]|uniref:Taste receptor type 1 member 1 isoform X1 n=3 Tax=Cricetulus griseus TaxID=10029 RepID=A0A9J7GMV6_CRIGR|nr:taste receptor type 1 member 1 isoform X1 [Cricetulus griseus]XP_035295266.1 taste receptor type 1 member 1 isoform X1 [Cricetulus griseus]ERE81899.1 taste receptor type 1 member 1-like protein [Cricetulus griseus]
MFVWAAYLLSLQLPIAFCWAYSCHKTESSPGFSLPGDYLLGGLFALHSDCLQVRHRPQVTRCDRPNSFNGHGYHLFQAMRFSIEEINNSTALLPNISLGYELFDVCSESANVYATLRVLAQRGTGHLEMQRDLHNYSSKVVALIGPDNTDHAVTTASLLGPFLMPMISYEASSVALSTKRQYPSFLRTIPSDKHQVEAMVLLLRSFGWVWISLIGSYGDYGQLGVQALEELAAPQGICIAFKDIVPFSAQVGDPKMQQMVHRLAQARTTVIVVFSNRYLARVFFMSVVLANLTGKVWIASEDWAISTYITKVPGIQGIGTVLGVAIQRRRVPGLKEFEESYIREVKGSPRSCPEGSWCSTNQLCRECHTFTTQSMPWLGAFSMSAAYNVYQAVYAVAHGLHQLLGCTSETCSRGPVYPWQLLQQIYKVNFLLQKDTVAFDDNGDPLGGYNIISWDWNGPEWTFEVIGSASVSPVQLDINKTKIQWHGKNNQVPTSVCTTDCLEGHHRVVVGSHHCCFECIPCEAGTFLNKSDLHICQPCAKEEWAPEGSTTCFPRTVEFLAWQEPISLVLLTANTLLLLLLVGTTGLFARHLHTPVVRSAGGRLCFLMLGSLAAGSCSFYGFFGEPTVPTCLLRQPLFSLGFAVFLSCLTIRSFQLVIIFKFSTKVPTFYHTWAQNHGAGLSVTASSTVHLLICVLWLAVWTPLPTREYQRFPHLVILECTEVNSAGFLLAFTHNILLSVSTFACSYLGKELPENYNEAKCVTFSLLLNFVSWIAFFTTSIIYQGSYLPAVYVMAGLATLSGGFSGYFLPKCYVILCRPDLNNAEHFQASILDYTRRSGST